MTTQIQIPRRRTVSLGATYVQTVNVPSRGSLSATILQISTRFPGGGTWVSYTSPPPRGTVLQQGRISVQGSNGTYAVTRSASGTFLTTMFQAGPGQPLRYYFFRGVQRSARPSRRMYGIPEDKMVGATNPNFVAPSASDVSNNPPGQALSDAGVALLAHFSSNGVPSEHTYDATVAAFQTAWNADPLSQVNANGTLSVDGGYGPNTHDALASIAGGSAPAVNTAPAPGGGAITPGATTTTTTTTTSTTNIFAGMPVWAKWVVGAAAVGGAYLVGKAAVKKHGPRVAGHARRLHGRLRQHARRLTRRPA